MRPGGVHRGGRIGLRERDTQRRPYADFFGYFLVQDKKVTVNGVIFGKRMTNLGWTMVEENGMMVSENET